MLAALLTRRRCHRCRLPSEIELLGKRISGCPCREGNQRAVWLEDLMIMPSNNSGLRIGYMAHKFSGRLGWLIGPGGWRKPPPWMPIALDNGAYGAWEKKKPWNEDAFWELLTMACAYSKPLWAVVPDVVTEKDATIDKWHEFAPKIRERFPDLPLAFAAQDGMTPADIPEGVHTVFVGGSFDWKWGNMDMWKKSGLRFHVGRVNTLNQVMKVYAAGASSCDGTGWMKHSTRLDELEEALAKTAGNYPARHAILERYEGLAGEGFYVPGK